MSPRIGQSNGDKVKVPLAAMAFMPVHTFGIFKTAATTLANIKALKKRTSRILDRFMPVRFLNYYHYTKNCKG